jgi:hypothetical protein
MKYIHNIPDSLVSEVPAKLVTGLKSRKTEKQVRPYDKYPVFPTLLEDFKKMHLDFEKRFLLQYP